MNNTTLILSYLLIIIVTGFLLSLKIGKLTVAHYIFSRIGECWKELRFFAFKNRTIFEIFFLLLYTLEQAFLIYIASHNKLTSEIVSYFALIVLLTFGFHRILMESRIRILESDYHDFKSKTLNEVKDEIKKVEQIIDKID